MPKERKQKAAFIVSDLCLFPYKLNVPKAIHNHSLDLAVQIIIAKLIATL